MCGVIGIISKEGDVMEDGIDLLNGENNRGEQACGAAVFDGKNTRFYRDEGWVSWVFSAKNYKRWSKLKGSVCVMQALYSTIGRGGKEKQPMMFQPFVFGWRGHRVALAHNGNLVGLDELRKQARRAGYIFKSNSSDTEVIVALLAISKKKTFLEALLNVLKKIEGKGAFSLVIMYRGKIYGVRDQNGIRPLCFGKKNGDIDNYILASESSVFPSLRSARFIR